MNPEHGGELALCVSRDHSFKATKLKASSLVRVVLVSEEAVFLVSRILF